MSIMCRNVASIVGYASITLTENEVGEVKHRLWSLKNYNVCNLEHSSLVNQKNLNDSDTSYS